MPYQTDCHCPICTQAQRAYGAEDNRRRYVDALEAGATAGEIAVYVSRMAGRDEANVPPAADWLPRYRTEVAFADRDEPCDCGNCEECGYADDEPDTQECGQREDPLPSAARNTSAFTPLARLLRRGGRYYSAEVEVNGISPYDAAQALGCEEDGYGSKPSRIATIVATDDCTVDAEIKLGRFRDGAKHAANALAVYETLRRNGATCAENTGHHVHVDATRITDLGTDAVERVLRASLTLADATELALRPLAASGYARHRDPSGMGYGGNLKCGVESALGARTGWHASNAHNLALYGSGIPTFEYRLPNGTLEPIRAHAHIAVALGLLDFGERCLDRDHEAREIERQAADRIAHAQHWSEADAANILTRALHLHPDSLNALAIAAATSPARETHRTVWNIAARSAA